MIELKTWTLILSFALPMIISPGPGNTILGASGAKFGVKNTVPFWLGFETGNLIWCLVYGFGLAQIFKNNPLLHDTLKWAGTAYILYIAWCFFHSSLAKEGKDLKPLSFFDGLNSLSLNPKVHSMIFVMFSQFLNPTHSLPEQVFPMTLLFVVLGLGCHFLWIYCGKILLQVKSARARQIQGIVFGTCMLIVATSVAMS